MSDARQRALAEIERVGNGRPEGDYRWGFDEGWDAAKADLPDRETLRDALAGWPIGRGYYQTTVAADEAGEMADAVLGLLRGETP